VPKIEAHGRKQGNGGTRGAGGKITAWDYKSRRGHSAALFLRQLALRKIAPGISRSHEMAIKMIGGGHNAAMIRLASVHAASFAAVVVLGVRYFLFVKVELN